jgi:CO/xanthine dehydrogenase FAD-binding subunit
VLGAGVTMSQVLASRELAFLAPVAQKVGGPAVRTTATVGGNLFARSPYGDFTCALLVLDAEVTLVGPAGETAWALEDFLLALDGPQRPAGIVSTVSFARPARDALRFRKVSRVRPKGIAVMTIAALLPSRASRIAGARIAYGSMARRPIRVRAVEQALEGQSLTDAGIAQALQHCLDGIDPPTDPIASGWYRREVAPVHLRRLLLAD